jgi:formate dehydrogenase gamma subunit
VSKLLKFALGVDRISEQFGHVAAFGVLAAALISAGNAFIRYGFDLSSNGWLEIQWYLFAATVMLGAPLVLKLNEHVRVDLLYGKLKGKAPIYVDLFGLVVFLLPVMGLTLFGWLTYALKNLHNFAGPVFAVSLVIIFVTFLRDNLPSRGDLVWLLKGGGLLSGKEVPSHRFNAGEKLVFWGGVFFLGIVVVGSGLVLDKLLPGLLYLRDTMQIAHMIHAAASVLMLAMFIGHIYIGTIGMQGAYQGKRTGYVDETWAREHHEIWYDDIKAGKIPAQRTQAAPPTQTVQI